MYVHLLTMFSTVTITNKTAKFNTVSVDLYINAINLSGKMRLCTTKYQLHICAICTLCVNQRYKESQIGDVHDNVGLFDIKSLLLNSGHSQIQPSFS